jgi:hypothetical protein
MIGPATQALKRARILFGVLVAILALAAAIASASSAAVAQAPEWVITSYAAPTNLPPGANGELIVTAVNVGGAATDGSTVKVEDTVPAALTVTSVSGVDIYAAGPFVSPLFSVPAAKMSCALAPEVKCTYDAPVQPGDQLVLKVKVAIGAGTSGSVLNQANVSGGGVQHSATVSSAAAVGSEPAGFGLAQGSVFAGLSSTQAGAHANVTTGFTIDNMYRSTFAGPQAVPVKEVKDVAFDLPPGAVGNTVGMPRCPAGRVVEALTSSNCPADTIVGVATVTLVVLNLPFKFVTPIYNIRPAPGEPAAFMFKVVLNPVRLDTTVLSDGNYGVRVTASDLAQTEPVLGSIVTIWGVPADHQGPGPIPVAGDEQAGVTSVGGAGASSSRVPLLSNPTQCGSPLTAVAQADSWRAPGHFDVAHAAMGSLTGCLEVPFASTFTFLPDTLEAGAPAGYNFDLKVHQENSPDSPSTSDVKSVSLTLPEGVVVNPSAAWGLKACSSAQFYGPSHPSQAPAPLAQCPREAQVGTVSVHTPALEEALEGVVYLAEPECDPCSPQDAEDGKMVKLFVQMVSEGEGGIVVKLEGHGMIDQQTGQITTVFDENPQLPFSEFKLKLSGGPRSVLANPRKCGAVKAIGDLEPWSILEAPGEAELVSDSHPFYEFEINQNCFGPQFHPSFVAGMPNIQAGAYGGFTLAFGRADNDEYLGQLMTTMPTGLLGKIAGIPLCEEAQAIAGTCGFASQIGTVEALTGPGANPFLVSGGHVYLTKGYGGAPYGLSIVVPAVAGPYTLSGTNGTGSVVVRAQIFVDEHTAQLRAVSGQLPSMLDGIPLQLKAVNVRIDKPQFTFNPTSCAKKSIVGTLTAVEGLSSTVTDSFQVTNCASLAFKPEFKVTTTGKTSRTSGAGLDVKLSYPKNSFGKYANIKAVKVALPKQLPSRLTTLQKACPDSTFNANPAACPAASRIGAATATTPILGDTLTGPAYFVSHGGAKFPELVVVLSGDGVTVQLDGETFISKAGITSSTFRQIPDVPVSTFELKLPQGPGSALAANGNLCTSMLKMPTAFTAQNGLVIHQTTPITATGCPKHKAKHKKKK